MKDPRVLDLSQIVILSLSEKGNSLNFITSLGTLFSLEVSYIYVNFANVRMDL